MHAYAISWVWRVLIMISTCAPCVSLQSFFSGSPFKSDLAKSLKNSRGQVVSSWRCSPLLGTVSRKVTIGGRSVVAPSWWTTGDWQFEQKRRAETSRFLMMIAKLEDQWVAGWSCNLSFGNPSHVALGGFPFSCMMFPAMFDRVMTPCRARPQTSWVDQRCWHGSAGSVESGLKFRTVPNYGDLQNVQGTQWKTT